MADETTFHLGEQEVQKRLGVFEQIGPWASQVVRPCLPSQHRDFYAELPFLVAAARDDRGRPWATLLSGEPGFTRAPNATHLEIETLPKAGDGLEGQLVAGRPIGLLGIELATRRRNRVNGRIGRSTVSGIELEVDQSFGNCPQYIREREWVRVGSPAPRPSAIRSRFFGPELRARIESADTFFIATGHQGDGSAASHGMDASHRGGSPGFVRLEGERRLVFPDYAGNNHFNTIGNLAVDARAGLLFVDFESGGLLQLTGRATIDWDSPAVAAHSGAHRLVRFELDEAIDLPGVLPIRWKTAEGAARKWVVTDKRRESADVTSFVFAPADADALPDFRPGQHLPIELDMPGETDSVRRTYSLSNAPGEGGYRISVKRESRGRASRFLHDRIQVGDLVKAQPPAGEFVLQAGDRPIVLLSAGIGVTPMLSMLRAQAASGDRRPVRFLHVARDGEHHAFKDEVRALISKMPAASLQVFYSQPGSGDVEGRDFDTRGRLDVSHIETSLRDAALANDLGNDLANDLANDLEAEADYYVCGPVGFMAAIGEALEARGVPAARIHSESFGPAKIR